MKKQTPIMIATKTLCILSLVFSIVSCASSTQAAENTVPAGYPEFSWDKVPVCIHLGKGEDDFTKKEISFMSQFPLVCIEKNQAAKKHGGMEIGTLVAAKAIKKQNPNSTVLFYMNSNIDYGSMYTTGPILDDDKHPEWAMKNVNGGYVTALGGKRRIFDPSNPDMRRWWHDLIKDMVSNKEIGGVFIDALPKYAATPDARREQWGAEKYEAAYAGVHTMLDSLHADLKGMNKMMIANYLRGNTDMMEDMGTHFFDHTDGAMMEHLAVLGTAEKENIANDIELIAEAGRRGKIVVVKGWPRHIFTDRSTYASLTPAQIEADAREDIVFPLACFLVGAGDYAYFCYSWGYGSRDGGLIDYDEYKKPLGKPLADAVKNGWVYTRSFENADVWLDIENKKAEINWK